MGNCRPRPRPEHRHPGNERGQVVGFMTVMAVSLIAMGAFTMDVGSWFWAHRSTQTAADASALAAAQALPADTPTAYGLGLEYANKNGGGVAGADIQFSSRTFTNDTVKVTARRTAPGFLSRVFGIGSVNVSAEATARAYNIASAMYAAPFAVEKSHPMISGGGCPCFGQQTQLDLDKIGPGAFKIVNLDGSHGGTGQQILAEWILRGFNGYMGKGWYYSDPGAKFNPGAVQNALDARIGDELLFPIYDQRRAQGANFEYRVVGFIGFTMTGYKARGNNGTLEGYFTRVIWEGIASESADDYYGVRVVKLVG